MTHVLTGWKRQKYDPRDLHFQAPRRLTLNLPPTFDLIAGMGPMLDQGQLGSCGPNTASEMIAFDQKVESIPVATPSRLFIYYNARSIMGTVGEDSGVDNRSMMQGLQKFGYVPETTVPYDITKFTQKPSQSVYDSAAVNKITNYAAVTQALAQMQGTIAGGRPFCFGFDVFQQIMSDQAAATGIVTNPSGSSIGGHDVTILGYTNVDLPGVTPGKKWPAGTFKFRNHWANGDGSPWGDGGYGYISFDYAAGQHAGDFWVINAIPGGVTPVPVPPGPGPVPSGGIRLYPAKPLTISVNLDGNQVSSSSSWAEGEASKSITVSVSRKPQIG